MDGQIEHEICGNCKKEIPQQNYVMHTAHCARNITLCQVCKEPIPKSEFNNHKKHCVAVKPKVKKNEPPPTNLEQSEYYSERKAIEEKKIAARKEKQIKKYEKLVDTGYSLKASSVNTTQKVEQKKETKRKDSGLLACKFCELELPKLELQEHEDYCGSRTDRCLECGQLVMFKDKQIHMDSNHGFLKRKNESVPTASWDSTTRRSTISETSVTPRSRPLRSFSSFDATSYSFPTTYTPPIAAKEKSETYKEISRRLDCKTEYIRNLLHDSASITVPLRHNGAVPRNHFNHNKGPAPLPPRRKPNPPTELTIPCEFCGVPIPHEDLIQHETGCRPDLARFNPRRRLSPEPDDYFVAPPPSSPEVELPCEFCADMIPASQLLRHQATCI